MHRSEEEAEVKQMVQIYEVAEQQSAKRGQREIFDIIASLGGSARAYRQERAQQSRASVQRSTLLHASVRWRFVSRNMGALLA